MAYNPNPYADLLPINRFYHPPPVRRALFFDPAPIDYGEDQHPLAPRRPKRYLMLGDAARRDADAWLDQD